MKTNNRLVRLAVLQALACASGMLLATPGSASADPTRFDIAAQPLPNALKNFAAQAKMQLLYRYDIVSHATASPVTGQFEKHAALEQLLQGTGLEAVYSNESTATIRLISAGEKAAAGSKTAIGDKPSPANSPPTSSTTPDQGPVNIRLAQANTATQPPRGTASDSAADTVIVPEIIVVGVRAALATAQQVKKDAATFVDSITATDIGAFPDKSASDALQRLPGITVNRLQSNDDVSHPSGEPTNILIRGLTQVRTEFNGRDTFTADPAGRGINFNDISPELRSDSDRAAPSRLSTRTIRKPCSPPFNASTRATTTHGSRTPVTRSLKTGLTAHPPSTRGPLRPWLAARLWCSARTACCSRDS